MSFKRKLRAVVVCLVLQGGVFVHVPMRPEHIEELMRQMNRPKLAHLLPSEDHEGDGDPSGSAASNKIGTVSDRR